MNVLLSVMNLDVKDLDRMNIGCRCVVINQCGKNDYYKYKNFEVYCFDETGLSNSRNRGLEKIGDGIVLLCDDDVIYKDSYVDLVKKEFEKSDADVMFFNYKVSNRNKRIIKKRKRMHIYNSLNFASYNIAFKRDKIGDIRFNSLFGAGAKYSNGEESLFIVDCLRKKLKIYSSPIYLGSVSNENSTWFKGYDFKYFFDKGALFTAISPFFRHILMFQYLVRHRDILVNFKLFQAYKIMLKGSKEYLHDISNN